ncbi:MAG: HlyD family efflux transporter periplasmic adaptor subunit [Coriobacteriia bacterium]|nr:HlyD family efflux transporter periplasmic adaptor subunit [Coriobacteriia bacterium]
MSSRTPIALLIAAALASAGCVPATGMAGGTLTASGRVRDDTIVLRAPFPQRTPLDAAIGIPGVRTVPVASARSARSALPTISATLVAVEASAGTEVTAGAVLARLDDRDAAIGVTLAGAAARKAHADVDVIDARLGDVRTATSDLNAMRADVLAAVTKARAARATLLSNIALLEPIVAKLPPLPAPIPVPGPDPRVMLPRLKATLAKLDASLLKADAGLRKVATGRAKLRDARSMLTGARGILRDVATAADIGVSVAKAKQAQSVVSAPTDGVVSWIAEPGTVLMADAPVARILPASPTVVETYLTAEDAARVRPGMRARVTVDADPGSTLPATVTRIGALYEYPPTALPTTEIHMLRAVLVVVTLDDTSDRLPPGTPADITIDTN